MTESLKHLFFALLLADISGDCASLSPRALDDESVRDLFFTAKKHEISGLLADAVLKAPLEISDEWKKRLTQSAFFSVRQSNLNREAFLRVKSILNEKDIPFLPLKGTVLKRFYPQEWMRSSCDVDVLVRKEDFPSAVAELEKQEDFVRGEETPHDVAFKTPDGATVEIHHSLIESGRIGTAEKVLNKIWEETSPTGDGCELRLSDRMFYYYHLAHMAKHLEGGGCGIRPFLDLLILYRHIDCASATPLLEEGHLSAFAEEAETLTRFWFDGGEASEDTLLLEKTVINGGFVGNPESLIFIQRTQKWKYLGQRIWIPFRRMREKHPVLKKWPILLPFFEIARWFLLLSPKRRKNSLSALKKMTLPADDEQVRMNRMWERFGFRR